MFEEPRELNIDAYVATLRSISRRSTGGVEIRQRELLEIQRQIRDLKSVAELGQKASDALASGHFGLAFRFLADAKGARSYLDSAEEDVARELTSMERQLQRKVDENLAETANSFPAALRDLEIEADRGSRDPRYTFNNMFIEAYFDRKFRNAIVTTRNGKPTKMAPDVTLVAKKILDERRRLFDRKFDPNKFAKRLKAAYLAEKKINKSVDSQPILRVFERFTSKDKSPSLDEFNVDLALLVSSGDRIEEAKGLHLDQIKNEREGLLLYGRDENGYVGYIRFN